MKDIIVKTSTIRELCQASIARINEYAERIETLEKERAQEIEEHQVLEWEAALELYRLKNRNMFYCPDFPLFRTMRYSRYSTSYIKVLLESLEEKEKMCFTGEEFLSMHPTEYAKLLRKGEIQVEDLEHWLSFSLEDFSHFHRKELEEWKKGEAEQEAEMERYKQERDKKKAEEREAILSYWTKNNEETTKPVAPPLVEVDPAPLPSPWWIMVGVIVFVAALVAGSMT